MTLRSLNCRSVTHLPVYFVISRMSKTVSATNVLFFAGISFAVTAVSWVIAKKRKIAQLEIETKEYTAACHCQSVKFKVRAPRHLTVWDCNCSICLMKKNWHFIVPASNFVLDQESEEFLTEYRFNTKVARHKFCKLCGVQAFYHPRSNPDGIAVTFACIPPNQVESSEVKKFDGQNWENFFGISGISKFSSST